MSMQVLATPDTQDPAPDLKILEEDLATALNAFKPFLLKKSHISIPKKKSEIGIGGFGTVHRGTLRKNLFSKRTHVAVKKLYTTGDWDKRVVTALALVQELMVWAILDHPNIISLLGFHLSTGLDEAWLISPYAANGNIYDYLERVRPTLTERLELVKGTARGLEYLHTREPPVCHGDIKSLNVLVDKQGQAMLCDFGLAKTAETVATPSTKVTSRANPGTLRYWSPELFVDGNRATLFSDVWAWGCLLLEIVTGLAPYNDITLEGRVIHQITENVLPATLEDLDCPAHVRELLSQCWQLSPGSRPTMTQALSSLSAGNIHLRRQEHEPLAPDPAQSASQYKELERELVEALTPLKRYRCTPSQFIFPKTDSTIGVGGYGTVHKATMRQGRRDPGVIVAVKKIKAAGGRDKSLRMAIALIRELAVWADIDHDNVVPLLGFHLSDGLEEAWMVSPYLGNGNLSDYILRVQPGWEKRLALALDTATGLSFLHNLKPPICHGDIKALNVLINDKGRAVLCDFGLAKTMEHMPSGLTTSTFNQGGSLPYESPELLLGTSNRTPESDVWAWGCMLQEIFTGNTPYHWAMNPGAIVKWIVNEIPPAVLDEVPCPRRVWRLLPYCWLTRPGLRPRMSQCVEVLSGSDSGSPQVQDGSAHADLILDELERAADNVLEDMLVKRSILMVDDTSKLSSSAYGALYRATLSSQTRGMDRGTVIAVRQIFTPKESELAARFRQDIVQKAKSWWNLKHPNVLRFCGYSAENESADVLMIFPYMPAGNLQAYLRSRSLEYAGRIKLALDIAEGLLYLHTRLSPICHGNLHPGNVLVNEAQGSRALLCDYGLAAMKESATNKDSFRYKSPEILMGTSEPTTRGDVWSAACMFLKMICNTLPYVDFDDAATLVSKLDTTRLPSAVDNLDCPNRIKNLFLICWRWEPESRASLSDVVSILSGKLFRSEQAFRAPSENVVCLKFSRDGKCLAVACRDDVKVYDTQTGKLECKLEPPSEIGNSKCMQFSPSGKLLAVGTGDHAILVWDLQTLRLKETFRGHTNDVTAVDVGADETFVLSASDDRTLRWWYLGDHGRQNRVVAITGDVLAIEPQGHVVAVGQHAEIQFLRTDIGESIGSIECKPRAYTLRFWNDGRHLFAGGADCKVRRWEVGNLNAGKPVGSVPRVAYGGHRANVSPVSAGGELVVSLSGDGDVRAVNTTSKANQTQSIGNLPPYGLDYRMDLGPLTEDGTILAANCPPGPEDFTVRRFISWDFPGAYRSYRGFSMSKT